ncbi:MAG: hypothetical protein AAF667_04285 [Pseudomonadota bacterium]
MLTTRLEALVALALVAYAIAMFLQPLQFLTRFSVMPFPPEQGRFALFGLAAGFVGLALALVVRPRQNAMWWALFAAISITAFVLQTFQLSDWWIDDAGITFAYSRSLSDGDGLTFQPWHPAEEGYSSTLWMLALASAASLGFDIPLAAKTLGIACGSLSIIAAVLAIKYRTNDLLSAAVALAVVTTTPFIVWSASGQEHALQALLLLLAALCLGHPVFHRLGIFWLTTLVLVRPEAPLIVAACFVASLVISHRQGRGMDLLRNLPIAVIPFIAFLGLMIFRVVYFGDPLPNPFYAKASGSGSLGLLNPFGGGWSYVFAFLSSSLVAIVVPFLLQPKDKGKQQPTSYLVAVLVGHLLFVVWANGDWMGQYRFIMPVLPILAILVASGFAARVPSVGASLVALITFLILSVNTVFALNEFKANPTTPLSVVATIGREFRDVGNRLGVEDPLLAHHDAGAIAYERSVRLVDLGGLVDREIAKNMKDAGFLEDYVLNQREPDFIFGAHNFAARSGFLETGTFEQLYVPIEFRGKPYMVSTYSHIRRDRVAEVPGLEIRRDASGAVIRVVVED